MAPSMYIAQARRFLAYKFYSNINQCVDQDTLHIHKLVRIQPPDSEIDPLPLIMNLMLSDCLRARDAKYLMVTIQLSRSCVHEVQANKPLSLL